MGQIRLMGHSSLEPPRACGSAAQSTDGQVAAWRTLECHGKTRVSLRVACARRRVSVLDTDLLIPLVQWMDLGSVRAVLSRGARNTVERCALGA